MAVLVYLRGFPKTYTTLDIRNLFRDFNPKRKVKIENKDNKHFAIVKFETKEIAEDAIKSFHQKELEGNQLYVKLCQNRYDEYKWHRFDNSTIYMRDFPEDITEEMIREAFDKYGVIEKITISEKACFISFDPDYFKKINKLPSIDIGGKRVYANYLIKKKRMKRIIRAKVAKAYPEYFK